MSRFAENLESFITDLLHIQEGNKNKLIDLVGDDPDKVYFLYRDDRGSNSRYVLNVIRSRIGKPANTALRCSSDVPDKELYVGPESNAVDWRDGNGRRDPAQLRKFIETVYRELDLRGNNPLFLSIGALCWDVEVKKGSITTVRTPLLLFPVRLVRTSVSNAPVHIEFINDDIYINPCLTAKFRQTWGEGAEELLRAFPHPNGPGATVDEPVDPAALGDGEAYLGRVGQYLDGLRRGEAVFAFEPETVAIAPYNHSELCMYYDIRRNREAIYQSALAERIFSPHEAFLPLPPTAAVPQFVLPRDSVQERIVTRVVNGESLVIKGPPGTGKTLTITNMIAALLAADKKVLLISQKPTALSEVYAKMPEPLRKFVMLLTSETESQAARLNPTDVRRNFNALLNEARTADRHDRAYDELRNGMDQTHLADGQLQDYRRRMFRDKNVIGRSCYEAMDILCRMADRPILFCDPEQALALTPAAYDKLYETVCEAGGDLDRIRCGRGVVRCPWRPLYGSLEQVDIEAALAAYQDILPAVNELQTKLNALWQTAGIDGTLLPLQAAAYLLASPASQEQIAAIRQDDAQATVARIAQTLRDYETTFAGGSDRVRLKDASQTVDVADHALWDLSQPVAAFELICRHRDAVELLTSPANISLLALYAQHAQALLLEMEQIREKLTGLFRPEALDEAACDQLTAAHRHLSRYSRKQLARGPRLFDAKSKKLAAAAQTWGYGNTVSLAEIAEAAAGACRVAECMEEMRQARIKLSSQLHRMLDDEQCVALTTVIRLAGADAAEYLKRFDRYKDTVSAALACVTCGEGATLGDLYRVLGGAAALRTLCDDIRSVGQADGGAFPTATEREILAGAGVIAAVHAAEKTGCLGRTTEEIADAVSRLYEAGQPALAPLDRVLRFFAAFGREHFRNYYTEPDSETTCADLAVFTAQAVDRNVIRAAREYLQRIYNAAGVELDRFFRPFETGERETGGHTYGEHFEHAVFHLAVQAASEAWGEERFGMGERVTQALEKWESGDDKIGKAALQLIERQCLSRIRPDDPQFAFLSADRVDGETLRRMFKKYARAILKLKKCFILSPAAVSVFFGDDAFSHFDIVIADEASQLTPTSVLPVLFRARQMVLVGDEWQMPPIRHFVAKESHQITEADGEIAYMDPDASVLNLALRNCAFPTEKLLCHYRSRTETLIRFSQGKFYEYMRTFPTPVPKTETLGLRDIYLPDGVCTEAVNKAEAACVVQELRRHFENHYRDGRLHVSVGVVAFGEKQIDYICSLIRADKTLYGQIQTALQNFGDMPEKLIFFKTILTVQGQETDHLILSLTYGKNGKGNVVQSFGELNLGHGTGKLGQCIFNVAVTRAKCMITLVHSVQAEEITNENVGFIREYLDVVRRFQETGRAQFVGDGIAEAPAGFFRDVAEYLVACGIEARRVVLNFGVTAGSVRIPVVVLSPDLQYAEAGIFCEIKDDGTYDYLDYNLRYYRILEGPDRGWKLRRLYLQDWIDNRESTQKALGEWIAPCVCQNRSI